MGAVVQLSEKGKRGVTRLRITWIATEVSSGDKVRKTKQSRRFVDTKSKHRFRSRHSFRLDEGLYQLRVSMTWVRKGSNWRRNVVGTCDLTTPDGPPPPPPDLPPDVPPPPGDTTADSPPRLAGPNARVVSSSGQVSCQNGQVSALAPGARTDRDEYVWWLSELWWWDPGTARWYVDSGSDLAYAYAMNGSITTAGAVMSMPVWRGYPSYQPVSQRTHTGMARGYYYTAVNWFWTESGGWVGYYTDHGGGVSYCYIA